MEKTLSELTREVTILQEKVGTLFEKDDNNAKWHRRLEEDIRSIDKKVNLKLDTITEILVELKHLRQDHNELKCTVNKYNEEPRNHLNTIKMAIATAIIGGFIGFLFKTMLG